MYNIYYDSHNLIYKSPFGAVPTDTVINFCIEAPFGAEVYLCISGKRRTFCDSHGDNIIKQDGYFYETYSEEIRMETKASDTWNSVRYLCSYKAPDRAITLEYYFRVSLSDSMIYYANNRRNAGGMGECYYNYEEAVKYSLTVYDKTFTIPNWFKRSIMYQIFPDRFYNGNEDGTVFVKEREAKEYKVYSSWTENMDLEYAFYDHERGERRIRNDFYGGNLQGILKKVDYLEKLGIDTIYLNPIFEAYSNHRYDTGDYMKIDPMLGSNEDFNRIAKELKDRGFKLILDGVFNHTGSDSRYFNKYGKYDSVGAAQSKESPYAQWYNFKDFDANPDDYDCWWGISNVPNVNEMCDSYFEFILGDDGVVQHWLQEGASGWRLDVADELPTEFLERLRAQAKKINEDAIIIGEVWEDASRKYSYGEQREYLLGKQLDSVMNYPFYDAVIGFVGGSLRAEQVAEKLMRIHENYPRECLYALMNIIGTHDKPRAKTLFGGGAYRDENLVGNGDATLSQQLANNRMKQAALFQMTYVGVPCIYYGDEIGMRGIGDPLNRGAFEWHDINEELLDFYKAAIELRKGHEELVSGDFHIIHAHANAFVFERFSDENCYAIILNSSSTDWYDYYFDFINSAFCKKIGEGAGLELKPVFGLCYVDGQIISVPPTGGAVVKIVSLGSDA